MLIRLKATTKVCEIFVEKPLFKDLMISWFEVCIRPALQTDFKQSSVLTTDDVIKVKEICEVHNNIALFSDEEALSYVNLL